MQNVNKLGLRVVLITTLVVVVAYAIFIGIQWLFSDRSVVEPEALPPAQNEAVLSQDTDQDGLPDAVEHIYQTDPTAADTDGDGTHDGDEVALQRNPSLPGPNDALPAEFSLGETLSLDTYTGRYLAQLPSNASRDQVLNSESLAAFVEKERLPALPNLVPGTVQVNAEAGKEAVQIYLDSISSSHNSSITAVSSADIELAFRQYYSNGAAVELDRLIKSLESNFAILQEVSAPKEAQALHTKLLMASQSLVDNTKLLKNMPTDFVGGLVGAKNIEDVGSVFSEISSEITALETQYDIQ